MKVYRCVFFELELLWTITGESRRLGGGGGRECKEQQDWECAYIKLEWKHYVDLIVALSVCSSLTYYCNAPIGHNLWLTKKEKDFQRNLIKKPKFIGRLTIWDR